MRTSEENKIYMRIWRKQITDSNKKLIGNNCFICHTTENLVFHEIHGINHNEHDDASFYRSHPKDFIPLCRKHHRILHTIEELVKMSDIEKFKMLVLIEKFI